LELNKFYNVDCMDIMKDIPDKYFELAIVDPPYGIGADNRADFGKIRSKSAATCTGNYKKNNWDKSIPDKNYFEELFRITKNQIIWGLIIIIVLIYLEEEFIGIKTIQIITRKALASWLLNHLGMA
jgi:DNA modification methylase